MTQISINESGKLIFTGEGCFLLNSRSPGKVYLLGKDGETIWSQKIILGENVINIPALANGQYAIRIENKNNTTLSSFEIQLKTA